MNPEQTRVTRLFSHLEFDGNQLHHQPGNVLGSIALISGTTIGAGVLALPSVTLPSGFVPSSTLLVLVWLYTLISSLLVAEITLHTIRSEGHPRIGLLAIVTKNFGNLGARIAGVTYLFMHYGILVAYIAKGGELLVYAVAKVCGLDHPLPNWLGTTTFTLIFGGIMYFGRERFVQKLNSIFVLIVVTSFLGLMLLGIGQVKSSYFLFQNWPAAGNAISIMFVAMFFHNIVPTVVMQLEGDVSKIRRSIIIGSLTPLAMYLSWNAVILGSVSPDILKDISGVFDPLQVLRSGSSGEWLSILVTIFSEFAIVTSFIGFVYSLLDFYQDFYVIAQSEITSFPLYSLVLLPPLGLGTINPSIFFTALDYTGILTNSILGVIIPALISWKQRQELSSKGEENLRLVPGGKLTLVVIMLIGVSLMVKKIFSL
jgi:tyrosine-specific transport protein